MQLPAITIACVMWGREGVWDVTTIFETNAQFLGLVGEYKNRQTSPAFD